MGNKLTNKKSSTELTSTQMTLLKANTEYTEDQIREWHAGFMRDCPSGRLNKKDFIKVYQQFYPQGKAENYCKHAFRTFDTNNDGFIDFQEFLLAIAASSQGDIEDRLHVAFEMLDCNRDGEIDHKELTTLLTAMYDLIGETNRSGDREPSIRAAAIIAELDVSGDKKLSKAEFIAGCKADPVICRLLAPNM